MAIIIILACILAIAAFVGMLFAPWIADLLTIAGRKLRQFHENHDRALDFYHQNGK